MALKSSVTATTNSTEDAIWNILETNTTSSSPNQNTTGLPLLPNTTYFEEPSANETLTNSSSIDFLSPMFDLGGNSTSDNATNNTSPLVIADVFFRYSLTLSVVLVLVYSAVFIIGIIGNCFVVAVVYRAPRMRTVTSFFIANLALADILVIVFCLPVTLIANIVTRKLLFLAYLIMYVPGASCYQYRQFKERLS